MKDNGYELFKLIHASKGMRCLDRLHSRSFSTNIYRVNAKELRHAIEITEDPEFGLQVFNVENREAGTQAHREINRLFHNYLAAAKTLIDHTRAFVGDHYKSSKFERLYKEKISAEFASDSVAKFVQDLRNFIVHRGLPHSEMHFTFNKEDGFSTGVRLDRDKLLEWGGWTAESRKYLKSQPERVSIRHIFEAYDEKVSNFSTWFDDTLRDYHKDDLFELELMQREYQEKHR